MTTERDIEELLPAYVNGTATREERTAVERALADDPALADETRFLEALQTRLGADPVRSPGELGWQRLRRDVRKDTPAPKPGRWRQALAAAAAVVIVVQGGLLWQAGDDGAVYRPLGSDGRADLQVRFVPEASAAEIETLLAEENLEIVAGPGAAGVYRLDALDEGVNLDALVERLASRGGVVVFVARE